MTHLELKSRNDVCVQIESFSKLNLSILSESSCIVNMMLLDFLKIKRSVFLVWILHMDQNRHNPTMDYERFTSKDMLKTCKRFEK